MIDSRRTKKWRSTDPATGNETRDCGPRALDPANHGIDPEFVRLPRPGERCPHTGLSRGSLNDLLLGPNAPVKSVVLKRDGARRGVRLIHKPSLMNYLHRKMAEQTGVPAINR